ncbi:hypothetical protein bwei_5378 [Bacillus mycoides]|nr:hypothetical protein [Bacillus mycoides]AIW87917.1 hypothetical protein bwei_5378 [Bacillus mycoides]EEL03126.1 hypothetical protein bcere0014_52950 [Bacillus cereus BDRD-ST196]
MNRAEWLQKIANIGYVVSYVVSAASQHDIQLAEELIAQVP